MLLALDGEQRIISNFGRCISCAVRILKCHKTLLTRALFQLLVLCSLDKVVDSPLAQEIRFGLFAGTNLTIGRALVHPVDPVYSLLAAGSLELPLQLLLCALFFDFIDALLGALALGEGLLFFLVDGLLISP